MAYDFQHLFDELHDAVYFVDLKRKITYWNKAAEVITGYKAKEVLGSSCADNILRHVDENGKSLCKGDCPLDRAMRSGFSGEAEVYMHHKGGHLVPVSVRVAPLKNDKGEVVGGAEMFTDISSKKVLAEQVERLEQLAMLDPLTQLSNRRHIEMELDIRFHERYRYGMNFGVLFMDIDDFKQVNDTHGHDVGDRVLKMVADTLKSSARPFDLFGRWGGEEFLGLIRNVDLVTLEEIGNRWRMLVEKAYIPVGNEFIHATVSMGATVPLAGDDGMSIINRADALLYKSKERGKNRLTAG